MFGAPVKDVRLMKRKDTGGLSMGRLGRLHQNYKWHTLFVVLGSEETVLWLGCFVIRVAT